VGQTFDPLQAVCFVSAEDLPLGLKAAKGSRIYWHLMQCMQQPPDGDGQSGEYEEEDKN